MSLFRRKTVASIITKHQKLAKELEAHQNASIVKADKSRLKALRHKTVAAYHESEEQDAQRIAEKVRSFFN